MIPQKTLFGASIRHYLNSDERSDVDIWEHCVQMVKDQIRDAPEGTAGILGENSFIYFKYLMYEKNNIQELWQIAAHFYHTHTAACDCVLAVTACFIWLLWEIRRESRESIQSRQWGNERPYMKIEKGGKLTWDWEENKEA